MIRVLTFLLSLLLPAVTWAQTYPALYDVSGVAADDVLNVRDAPAASGKVVGTLAPGATDIEVIRVQGNWAQVNTNERSGWASLSFLARQSGQSDDALTGQVSCFGTEPFWGMSIHPDGAQFEWIGEAPITFDSYQSVATPGVLGKFARLYTGRSRTGALLLASTRLCSDGMSDRTYGLAADLTIFPFIGQPTHYTGCCTLAPN
ncbi:COG3650 family protein [Roseovarius sp. MMSF_3281]|uniref:COG3650 family protein n=1 Tax=Roseovarius sp. MMSF_3281 TaxID=3046694 RepID=UPI00273F2201|nr:SH3 domain-containing protein [Roseovarius sp. MMSF_3281]